MSITYRRRRALVGALVAFAALGAACGCGDDTKPVTATDYTFQNLPKEVDAGTELKLKNASTKEVHEMVVFRIPDGERRSVQELVNLPESQQEAIFGSGPPAMVLVAPPKGGAGMIRALGDGKLTEAGRYAVVCFIPVGADPQAYLAAAQGPSDGPPPGGGGPPHAAQGMFGEITVK